MTVRVPELIGTDGADIDTAFSGGAYFGLGGADEFHAFPWSSNLVLVGGTGTDTYYAAANSVATIMDVGGTIGDLLVFPLFGSGRPSSYQAIIDGRHVLLADTEHRSVVIVLDAASPANRIETVRTTDGLFSFEALMPHAESAPHRAVSWEQIGAFGLRPIDTAEMNEAIAFYTQRALDLEGGAAVAPHDPVESAPAPQTGLSLHFTLATDHLGGTPDDDLGIAPLLPSDSDSMVASISSHDAADFAGGFDELHVHLNAGGDEASFGPRPTLNGLETIRFTPVGGPESDGISFDAAGTAGLQRLIVADQGADFSVVNLSMISPAEIRVVRPQSASDISFAFAAGTLSSLAGTASVTLEGNTGTITDFGTITLKSANDDEAVEILNLVSTGGAASNRIVNVIGGTELLNIDVSVSGLTIAGDTTHARVTVSGARDFTAMGKLVGTSVIDASNLVGRFVARVDDTIAVNIATGSGNDTIDYSDEQPGYTADDTWSGGGGTDRAIVRAQDLFHDGSRAVHQAQRNLTEIEQLHVRDQFDGIADLHHFSAVGIHDFFFQGTGDGNDEFNFSGIQNTITFSGDLGSDVAFNHVGLPFSDHLRIVLDGADIAGTISMREFENVDIHSLGSVDSGANALEGALSPSAFGGSFTKVTISGDARFVVHGPSRAPYLNAGAFSGDLVMSERVGTLLDHMGDGGGAFLVGGAGSDTLVGNAAPDRPDTIAGGDGEDRLLGTVLAAGSASDHQGDILSGGAGNDTFVFGAEDADAICRLSGGTDRLTHITDFVAGVDKIALVSEGRELSDFVLVERQLVRSAMDLADIYGSISPIPARADNLWYGTMVTVNAGAAAGTYLFINDSVTSVSSATDMLIDLTGISGTLTAGDIGFHPYARLEAAITPSEDFP